MAEAAARGLHSEGGHPAHLWRGERRGGLMGYTTMVEDLRAGTDHARSNKAGVLSPRGLWSSVGWGSVVKGCNITDGRQ